MEAASTTASAATPALGVLLGPAPGDQPRSSGLGPQQLLTQHPGGAYTTALVRGHCVVDWDLHVQRLLSNMQCLHQQRPPSFSTFLAWAADSGAEPLAALRAWVQPKVAAAVCGLNQQPGQQVEGEAAAMLVVMLEDGGVAGGGGDGAGAGAGAGAATGHAAPPLRCWVLCKPVHLPPPSQQQPVAALAAGAPRRWARAKHCQWVLDRASLEAAKAAHGAGEVLLQDAGGGLLEGLVNNFYVVAAAGGPVAAAHVGPAERCDGQAGGTAAAGSGASAGAGGAGGGPGGEFAGLVLQTSGPADEALPGVMQARVLQAARGLGLRVQLRAPAVAERGTWREAFLTNCLKGVQPVGRVFSTGPASLGAGSDDGGVWDARLPHEHGGVTARLRDEVARLQQLDDVRRWEQ